MSARPNFFVGIRLASPGFANAVVGVQDQVLQAAPHLHKCRMDARKLHLTCFVMSLNGTEQVNMASECLRSYQDELHALVSPLEKKEVAFRSVGNFTTKVLFASPEPDEVMQTLSIVNQQLHQRFIDTGIIASTSSSSHWHPHATILKTSYDRKNGSKLKIKPEDYAGAEVHLQSVAPPANETDDGNDVGTGQTTEGM